VRDRGLGNIQQLHNLVDAELAAATQLHNLLASLISQRLSKFHHIDRFRFHIDKRLCVII